MLLRDYAGRPTPLYLAERLSEVAGRRDLAQARGPACTPARTRSTTRSARRCWPSAWARRGSSPRPAPGQHGVATATACALLGLSASSTWAPRTCAASGPTSSAWSCSGATVAPVEAGARTLKEAVSEAIRDWVGERRRRPTTSSARPSGPAPYPAIVRDLQRVIGDEARAQMLERDGSAAGARDRLRRRRLQRDRDVHRRSSTTRRRAGRRRGRGRGPRHRAATARR